MNPTIARSGREGGTHDTGALSGGRVTSSIGLHDNKAKAKAHLYITIPVKNKSNNEKNAKGFMTTSNHSFVHSFIHSFLCFCVEYTGLDY